MFRAGFFDKFLKPKRDSNYGIRKYNSNEKFILQDKINQMLKEIDIKISENSSALLEAQIVKFRSTLSTSNNLITKIGRNVYRTKLDESITWHHNQLKELYFQRKELQTNLEKLKGIFWLNRIKRFIKILSAGILLLLTIVIFLSGFMIIIYLSPLVLLLFMGYWIKSKNYWK